MNDIIRLCMERATKSYGGNDGTFNAACFSKALCEVAQCTGSLDGKVVRVILGGRQDVKVLKGGCHYRIVEEV